MTHAHWIAFSRVLCTALIIFVTGTVYTATREYGTWIYHLTMVLFSIILIVVIIRRMIEFFSIPKED